MNSEYCVHCGRKNYFEVEPPKFCSGCGKSSNEGGSSASHEKREDIPSSVPKISRRNAVIEVNLDTMKPMKFGEVFGTIKKEDMKDEFFKRDSPQKPKNYDPLHQSIKECSPVRQSKDINER